MCTYLNPMALGECAVCGSSKEDGGGEGGEGEEGGGLGGFEEDEEPPALDEDGPPPIDDEPPTREGGGGGSPNLDEGPPNLDEDPPNLDEGPDSTQSFEAPDPSLLLGAGVADGGGGCEGGGEGGGGGSGEGSEAEFAAALSLPWGPSQDAALVGLLNKLCEERGEEPEHLGRAALEAALGDPDSPAARDLAPRPPRALLARAALLLSLNARVLELLPLVELDLALRYGAIGAVRTAAASSASSASDDSAPAPATPGASFLGDWVCGHRQLLLTRTKLRRWRSLVEATETYVAPPLDEYEPPSDVARLRVNRIGAGPLALKELGKAEKHAASIFGQLQRETAGCAAATRTHKHPPFVNSSFASSQPPSVLSPFLPSPPSLP